MPPSLRGAFLGLAPTMKKTLLILLSLLSMSILANGDLPLCDGTQERTQCEKEWTLLIYMAADNDLSPYAFWDIYEMERKVKGEKNLGASSSKVDVIVELDSAYRDGITRYQIRQSDKPYDDRLGIEDFKKFNRSNIESPVLSNFPEEGLSAFNRFKNFIESSKKSFPAKRYMVVLWGHGEGYIGNKVNPEVATYVEQEVESAYFSLEDMDLGFDDLPLPRKFPLQKPFGGIGFDYSDETYLSIPQIAEVLEGQEIDILSMDACLMQSLEVATELLESADYIVGSTQIQNYLGLPYRKVLDQMNSNIETFDLARNLPKMIEASFEDGGYQGKVDPSGIKTFTASTLATWQVRYGLLPQLDRLGFTLLKYLKEKESRRDELKYILEKSPNFQGETRDLGIFLGLVERLAFEEIQRGEGSTSSRWLMKEARNTHRQIVQSMISYSYGSVYLSDERSANDYMRGYFKGIGVWLPSNNTLYQNRKEEMENSQLLRALKGTWAKYLEEQFHDPFAGGFDLLGGALDASDSSSPFDF